MADFSGFTDKEVEAERDRRWAAKWEASRATREAAEQKDRDAALRAFAALGPPPEGETSILPSIYRAVSAIGQIDDLDEPIEILCSVIWLWLDGETAVAEAEPRSVIGLWLTDICKAVTALSLVNQAAYVGLVAKKEEAAHVAPVADSMASAPAMTLQATPEDGASYYKKLSVKLDRERYVALKRIGTDLDKNSQQILTQALDEWLSKQQQSGDLFGR